MNRDALAALVIAVLVAACATPPEPPPVAPVAATWYTPLPHGGTAAGLAHWWEQFDDPVLSRLVAAAESVSPTVASAGARIADARSRRVAAGAALLPSLDAGVNASRGRQDLSLPLGTSEGAGLQASWEIDLFGRGRAARDAAQARLVRRRSELARRARLGRGRDREPVRRAARLRSATGTGAPRRRLAPPRRRDSPTSA